MIILFAIQLSLSFKYPQTMRELHTQVRCPFLLPLLDKGTILPVVREITRIKKVYKRIILESDQEFAKGLLLRNTYNNFKWKWELHVQRSYLKIPTVLIRAICYS